MEIKLINANVLHKTYGAGQIVSVEKNHVEVLFAGSNKKYIFQFPFCFDRFLELQDSKLQQQIKPLVEQWRIDNGVDRHEKLLAQYEKTCHGISDRRRRAEEKKILSAQRTAAMRLNISSRNNNWGKSQTIKENKNVKSNN